MIYVKIKERTPFIMDKNKYNNKNDLQLTRICNVLIEVAERNKELIEKVYNAKREKGAA